jgi:hypothetical protein
MAQRVEVAWASLSPAGLPQRLLWRADSPSAETPEATRTAAIGVLHRTTRVGGRAQHLPGPGSVFAAPLSTPATATLPPWASVRGGALVSVQGRALPALVGALAPQRRLPRAVRHVWRGARGIRSRPLLRALSKRDHCVRGSVRGTQVVSCAPAAPAAGPATRQLPVAGQQYRGDPLHSRGADRLREQQRVLRVHGRERIVNVWEVTALLRGVWRGRALPVRMILLWVPGRKLQPWDVLTTALDREPREAVRASEGRDHIELHSADVKERGVEHDHGRSGQGVRRWSLLLCLGQRILKCIATRVLPVELPE